LAGTSWPTTQATRTSVEIPATGCHRPPSYARLATASRAPSATVRTVPRFDHCTVAFLCLPLAPLAIVICHLRGMHGRVHLVTLFNLQLHRCRRAWLMTQAASSVALTWIPTVSRTGSSRRSYHHDPPRCRRRPRRRQTMTHGSIMTARRGSDGRKRTGKRQGGTPRSKQRQRRRRNIVAGHRQACSGRRKRPQKLGQRCYHTLLVEYAKVRGKCIGI
jgi:hypothetical protein